jgi:hypothetical protein
MPHIEACWLLYTIWHQHSNQQQQKLQMTTSPQPQPQHATIIQLPVSQPAISNDTWISKYEGCGISIKFGKFLKLLDRDAWRHFRDGKGIYALYYIPDALMTQLNTLPVVNEHVIYVGESSHCLYGRFNKFKATLNQLMQHRVASTGTTGGSLIPRSSHSAASHFFNEVSASTSDVYYDKDTHDFIRVDGYTLMVRIAVEQSNWIYDTADHERSFLTAVKAINPPRLYNIK